MSFSNRLGEWAVAISVFLTASRPLAVSMLADSEQELSKKLPAVAEKNIPATSVEKNAPSPNFLIWLDLAKFKVRLFEDGQAVDSGFVGSGRRYSPTLEIQRNWLIERPSFNPTQNEKKAGKFSKPVQPDRLPMGSARSTNPQGRGKILLVGYFGIHGTNRPGLLPGNISSGCCRMDNLFNDRLHALLKHSLPVRKIAGGGPTKYYYFNKSFRVRLSYSLWDIQSLTDSTLSMRVWPDVHANLADPPRPHDVMPNDSVPGNGYKMWHLIHDAQGRGWELRRGLQPDSPQVKQFWGQLRQNLLQVKKRGQPLVMPQRIFVKR